MGYLRAGGYCSDHGNVQWVIGATVARTRARAYASGMKTADAVRALLGGTVVYVAMAACGGADQRLLGAGEQPALGGPNAGAGGASAVPDTGPIDGATGADAHDSGASDGGGLLDALTNPIREAMAQADAGQAGPQVNDVPCDKTFVPGSPLKFAVMEYPGASLESLASVVALSHLPRPPPGEGGNEGYVWKPIYIVMRPGSIAAMCSNENDFVRFIQP